MTDLNIHSKSYQEWLAKDTERKKTVCVYCGKESSLGNPLIKDVKGRPIHSDCETERTRAWLKSKMRLKDEKSNEPKKDVEKWIQERLTK